MMQLTYFLLRVSIMFIDNFPQASIRRNEFTEDGLESLCVDEFDLCRIFGISTFDVYVFFRWQRVLLPFPFLRLLDLCLIDCWLYEDCTAAKFSRASATTTAPLHPGIKIVRHEILDDSLTCGKVASLFWHSALMGARGGELLPWQQLQYR
jgi:hypothetical protein